MAWQRKLGRSTDQRIAMIKNLVTSFLKHGKITTTLTRAKETQSLAEKMITLAKRGDLHAKDRFFLLLKSRKLLLVYFQMLHLSIRREMVGILE